MGCDIHFYVEVRKDGKWVSADKWHVEEDGCKRTKMKEEFYGDRNYALFSMLANVRNGYGFAGCDTGDALTPICEPKGIPPDCSQEIKEVIERWDCDGHSHSYLTVAELMAYDWTQTATYRGWVNGPEYAEWQRCKDWRNGPKSYCGGVGGSQVRQVEETEMAQRLSVIKNEFEGKWDALEKAIAKELGSTYCNVQWEEPYYEAARSFLGKTLPRLWRLGKPEDVRCVFFFDN